MKIPEEKKEAQEQLQDQPDIDKIWEEQYPDLTDFRRGTRLRLLQYVGDNPDRIAKLKKLNEVSGRLRQHNEDSQRQLRIGLREWGVLN